MYIFSDHQKKQAEGINKIEALVKNNNLKFSTVSPVVDYKNDSRICLTSVHLLHNNLIKQIEEKIINPLKRISPKHHYYSPCSLHTTIKNIRVINNPPHFTNKDIEKVNQVFSEVIPHHKKFKVYFYRLLLFPANLALIGTTDSELDKIILDLDEKLKKAGVADDKKYASNKYFFSNITLARFSSPLTNKFRKKIYQLSDISFDPYTVDSVTLLTCNAVLKKKHIINTWLLK